MSEVAAAPPLWRQFQAAAGVVALVRQGVSGTSALDGVEGALRPGVQALVFHVLRHLGLAEALRAQLAKRPPPPLGDALLCTALALAAPDADARTVAYEAFTLVDQAVEAAKRNPRTRPQANFINACLRRLLRERESLLATVAADPVAAWNHPRWWIDRLKQDWPQDWQAILRADNVRAPMTLRVNLQRGSVAERQASLARAGLAAQAVGDQGLALEQARPVADIPGFAEGALSVQDAAAQLAAPLLLGGLDLSRPLRVLDACAAPGGKTAHLLELLTHPAHGCSDSRVVALEIDPLRCQKIRDTLRRQGLEDRAQILVADAARPADWQRMPGAQGPFDAILLDAPCTASGIVRRHPDIRWLRRASDIAQLAAVQAALLKALWPLLTPGGRLLYCTCSVFPAEGRDQIQTFVTHNTDAFLRPSPGHLKPQTRANDEAVPDNLKGDHDGFYYALLEKRPA